MPIMDSILEIESQQDLWARQINTFHLWAIIRPKVILEVFNREYGDDLIKNPDNIASNRMQKVIDSTTKILEYQKTWRMLFGALQQNLYDVLFIKANHTRYNHPNENISHDRLFDSYTSQFANPLILETNYSNLKFKPYANYDANLFSMNAFNQIVSIQKKIQPKLPIDEQIVEDFVDQVVQQFDVTHLRQYLTQFIIQNLIAYPIQKHLFERRIMPKLKSKHVFFHAASYMGREAVWMRIFHDLGFTVHEPQHGVIYPSHFAYNYPSTHHSIEHPIRSYLPDTFLSYGTYWSDNIRLPVRCIPVGYHRLNENRREIAININPQNILIISGAVGDGQTNPMAKIAVDLATAYPDKPIILKLHPLEFVKRPTYDYMDKYDNLSVMTGADIFELIPDADVIIGNASTVLFEATIYPNRRIFYRENDLMPQPGQAYKTSEELIEWVAEPTQGVVDVMPDDFWYPDWENNFKNFADEQGILLT